MVAYRATLVRGDNYYCFDKAWTPSSRTHEVTEEQKEHLETNAIDVVTVIDGGVSKGQQMQKFRFERIEGQQRMRRSRRPAEEV